MRIHKSGNQLNRPKCGSTKYFNAVCKHPVLGPNGRFAVHIIEVLTPNNRTANKLLSREKFLAMKEKDIENDNI